MGAAWGNGGRVGALRGTYPGVLARRYPDGPDRLSDHDLPMYRLTRVVTVVPLVLIASRCLLDAPAGQTRAPQALALFVLPSASRADVVTAGARCRNGRLPAILRAQAAPTCLPVLRHGTPPARSTGPLAAWVLLGDLCGVWRVRSPLVGGAWGIGRDRATFLMAVRHAVPKVPVGRMLWGPSGFSGLIVALHADRGEQAGAAVTRERLRFPRAPTTCCQESAAMPDASRQALTDVRVVADGHPYLISLTAEHAMGAATDGSVDHGRRAPDAQQGRRPPHHAHRVQRRRAARHGERRRRPPRRRTPRRPREPADLGARLA